ncbi:acyltransferase family protein [Microbacterium azadirachtae]|uniref:acyltransferase family protein n=1 Tax=Microbacterium azadirachtae TaxID=582680 RepID=UPI0008922F5E|nr:acyltransferase family protein [Microbacterium azadirachtae]SDM50755.1 Peptidoglycan/LPS O-acetylase OafA/YrhL, contains acyltransferase and SGNH-hydrolase domains [Microbacterium azadirachtae]SEG58649.1 Peptidoglycan/LPS O-acetylase OafA/YrhL, contains acyltransferase and SGNH-hydrolase domains [Microbacterium azadirachtae]SEG63029.1 Peptidoglycan/LPS O-acetylase OafA/YrhL, contains acyltransferase and SGNH-hydrolase domains [Microbacterium azadirachtae]
MTVDTHSRRAHRAAVARTSALQRQRQGHRSDIDGLRAVAILLVVVYHVWIGRVSGGVDVFLMISAFFLTGSFVRRMEAGKPLAIGAFLLSRFRRLMPAAAVVLAATLGACWLLLPQTSWPQLWKEGWASLGYVQNWVLANDGVDYYAHDSALASPLQHFWSLSVQGQVFVLWPLLFLVGALIVRTTGRSAGGVMAVLFGVVFAGSLAFSVWETAGQQTFAYFDTRARLWEFAAGSLLALALPHVRLPRVLRAALGWIGLFGLVVCGMVIDVRGGFPGYLALWPIVSAALVIVSGTRPDDEGSTSADLGPGRILATRPVLAVGRDAYALYLVHWPILILWLSWRGQTQASALDGALIIASSLVLARVITLWVERPLRLRAGDGGVPWRNAAVIVCCIALVTAVLAPWQWNVTSQAAALQQAYKKAYTGAQGAPGTTEDDGIPIIPSVSGPEAENWTELDRACSGRFASDVDIVQENCQQTSNADSASRVVVVMGNSHAQQMTSAVRAVADRRGWGVVMIFRPWCSLAADHPMAVPEHLCDEWQAAALDHVLTIHPDAFFTIVTAASADSPDEEAIAGLGDLLDTFDAAAIPVVGVRDNPRSGETNYYTCAIERQFCDFPAESALAPENPAAEYADRMTLIDFTPWLCPDGTCHVVIGHIAVYLDMNHLSAQFARTLGPALEQQLGDDFLKP